MTIIWFKNIEKALKGSRVFLSITGIGYAFKYHLTYVTILVAYNFSALCLLVYSIYVYLDDIEKVSNIIHHAVLVVDVIVAAIISYCFHEEADTFLIDPGSSYNYESSIMFKKIEEGKIMLAVSYRVMFKYIVWSMIYLLTLMNMLAVCQRYLNNEEILLLFPCYFPFPVDNYFTHVAVFIWQELIVTYIGFLVFSALLFTHCVYSHVKTEIDILKFAMNNIEERAHEMARKHKEYRDPTANTEILSRCYVKCTRMCAEHHSLIIKYFHHGELLIEIIYFLVFFTGLVVCTCTGFALISENTPLKIKFIGITVIEIIFLYIMCWIAEETAEQSQSVKDIVYAMEWYRLPKECHNILIIMMIRASKPLLMRMLTGQKVDLAAYMALIKASYSYFNMMLATMQ